MDNTLGEKYFIHVRVSAGCDIEISRFFDLTLS